MSKKKNILMILESQVDKIVLGVIILISLAFLWFYVVGNPYGVKVRIGGRETSVNPGNIDRKVKDDAQKLLVDLDQPPEPGPYSNFNVTSLADYTRKMQCSVSDIASDLSVPYPGVGEAAIEEDRIYAMPAIPDLTDVKTAVLRGAAQVPVEDVTPGTPYESVETKLADMDFVTVSAHFDMQRLFNNFQLSFDGPGLKSSWRDERLATPVFAQFELQRRTQLDDGTYSEWTTVPRTKIDPYKKLLEQLPLQADQMQFGVNVWMSQYRTNDVQHDILQPEAYRFGISRVEWMPPEFLHETYQIMEKEAEQQKREAREERLKSRETDRRTNTPERGTDRRTNTPERGADRRTTTNRRPTQATRPGVGPRDMEPTIAEPTRGTLRRPAERTLQNVERDMQSAMLKTTARLDSLRDPVMVWVHDDTVQPGQTYEYRIRIGVFNPITGKDWFQKDQAALKDQTVLWSAFSEPTEAIKIPKMLHVFPMETVKNDAKAIEGVKVEVAKYYMGRWQSHEFDVYPGQTIGYPVEETPKSNTLAQPGGFAEPVGVIGNTAAATKTVDYTSGMTLVDVIAKISWGTNLRRTDYENMLYYDAGNMAEMGIGKSNWSALLKDAYDAVQDAMTQAVQQREQMMDMPGRRMFDGPREMDRGPRGL